MLSILDCLNPAPVTKPLPILPRLTRHCHCPTIVRQVTVVQFLGRDPVYDARAATAADIETIRRLLRYSWRVHLAGDPETWNSRIGFGLTWVLGAGKRIMGLISASMRPFSIACIFAAAVSNGERVTTYADSLLPAVEAGVRAHGAAALIHVGHALWLVEMLEARGFRQRDTVVTYGWNASPLHVAGNPAITVRPAAATDLANIVALDQRIFGPVWHIPATELEPALRRGFAFKVATAAGHIVGYQWSKIDETHAHLTRLAVSPEWQDNGVGTRLLTDALAGMVEGGITWVTLNTQLSNPRARSLYERYGFRALGAPAPVMWKDLRRSAPDRHRPSTTSAGSQCTRLLSTPLSPRREQGTTAAQCGWTCDLALPGRDQRPR